LRVQGDVWEPGTIEKEGESQGNISVRIGLAVTAMGGRRPERPCLGGRGKVRPEKLDRLEGFGERGGTRAV